jgi:predicted small lipoprotein YifL
MKTTLLVSASLAALAVLTGCGNARTPEVYRDDTRAVLEKKNEDVRACYDGVLKAIPARQVR